VTDIDKIDDDCPEPSGSSSPDQPGSSAATSQIGLGKRKSGASDHLGQLLISLRPLLVFWLSVIVLGYLCYLAAQALLTS
jgi:hypothetical protein